MNKMYHVFSEGENVLFREATDYIFFNNKFASSSYSFRLQPWALTIMSTHFHAIIETVDESAVNGFIFKLRKAYAMYYAFKYGHTLGDSFRVSKKELLGRESIHNGLLYVLKNAVHHYVCAYPFEYPYSSVHYYFIDNLILSFIKESFYSRTSRIGDLSIREKKEIIARDCVPEEWLVYDNGMILPSSYINTVRVRAIWNGNVKQFMFDINKNQTDAKQEVMRTDLLDIRISGLSDIEVCYIIDSFSTSNGQRSFHYLESKERESLVRVLKQRAVEEPQIKRCLWK